MMLSTQLMAQPTLASVPVSRADNMNKILVWAKAVLWDAGAVLIAVALVILARPLMVAGMALAGAAVILCGLSPRFA